MGSIGGADPWAVARELGISIRSIRDVPFEIATTKNLALIAWHPDERVTKARAWDGLARCILTRTGKRWGDDDALQLSARLRIGALIMH